LADAQVQEVLKGFVLLRMDLTERGGDSPAQQAAAKFGVRFIPDVRILAADGSEKQKVEARTSADLVAELKAALAK
jgi:thiol:disulfide interchange protein